MVVSTDQWCAEVGSFNCHRLWLSIFKWNNNHVLKDRFYIFYDVQSAKF